MTSNPRPNRPNENCMKSQDRKNVKVLFTDFFRFQREKEEFLPCGRTIHKEYYLEVMPRLNKAIGRRLLECSRSHLTALCDCFDKNHNPSFTSTTMFAENAPVTCFYCQG